MSLATPAEATVIINARPDLARAVGAQGVQLGSADLSVPDARRVLRVGWIGRSVHTTAEAREAIADGADYLLLGSIFETATHPGRAGLGLGVLTEVVALGTPVIAIGGITSDRAAEVKGTGAWGVAAVRAFWHATDPYAAAMEMVAPWSTDE
jgi:thiamine-phosphate diphosphorylase